jgi:hypothetical protein
MEFKPESSDKINAKIEISSLNNKFIVFLSIALKPFALLRLFLLSLTVA